MRLLGNEFARSYVGHNGLPAMVGGSGNIANIKGESPADRGQIPINLSRRISDKIA
jgi:hypothetical protein